MKTGRLALRLSLITTTLFFLAVIAQAENRKSYTLAVIPQLPPVTMYANWIPFAERLSAETGLPVKLKVYEKMDDFEDELRKGGPDFVFTNPTQAVLAHISSGYIPLVRSKHKVSGIAFVKKDSPAASLRDLNGKEIALAGRKNLCSVLVRHAMQSGKDKTDFTPVFVGSSINILKSVLLDKTSAGVTLDTELSGYPEDMTSQIRILFSSPPTAPHPLEAHPRVAAGVRETLAAAVLKMANDPEGRRMLEKIGLRDPIRADYARDYKPLEKIDLKGLTSGE